MNKRKKAILPLLVGSIILLLLTVLPHHHHGDIICFIPSHCSPEDHHQSCHHDHPSGEHGQSCFLNFIYETEITREHLLECNCCPDTHTEHFSLISILPENRFSINKEQEVRKCLSIPYREQFYPQILISSGAGRAPPFC